MAAVLEKLSLESMAQELIDRAIRTDDKDLKLRGCEASRILGNCKGLCEACFLYIE